MHSLPPASTHVPRWGRYHGYVTLTHYSYFRGFGGDRRVRLWLQSMIGHHRVEIAIGNAEIGIVTMRQAEVT